MLNLTAGQIGKLESCRSAAAAFFGEFASEEELAEARRLLALELAACAEEAQRRLRSRREKR